MERIRAVVVYLRADLLPRAYAWCAARGYTVAYAVPKSRYSEAIDLAYAERLVVVAASPDSVAPDRVPRLEVVDWPTGSSESLRGDGASQ